jgi:hypothetical protein
MRRTRIAIPLAETSSLKERPPQTAVCMISISSELALGQYHSPFEMKSQNLALEGGKPDS